MANLSEKQRKLLESIGFGGINTVETARTRLINFLAENQVEDTDSDSLEELVTMAEIFYDPASVTTPAKKTPTPTKKTTAVVVEDEDEEEEDEEEDGNLIKSIGEDELDEFDDMDREELKAFKAENEIDSFKVMKSMSDDDIREALRAAISEPEEVPAPKKTIIKTSSAPVQVVKKSKVIIETDDDLDGLAHDVKSKGITTKKPVSTKETKQRSADDNRFDGRNIPEHLKFINPLKELFGEEGYQYDILKQGVTVRKMGKNAKITVMNFDELKIVDGELIGSLFLNRFKSVDELKDSLLEEYHEKEIGMFRGESHPCIRKVTMSELLEIMDSEGDVYKESLSRAGGTDSKMGVNRQKLEENLTNKKPAPSTKTIVKKTAPVIEEDDEDEEDEIVEKPKVVVKKKAAPIVDEEDDEDEEPVAKPKLVAKVTPKKK